MKRDTVDTVKEIGHEVAVAPRKFSEWMVGEFRHLSRVLWSSADRFYWDDGFSKAASLAYTTLFALVPIFTISFGLFASFEALRGQLSGIQSFVIRQFIPSGAGVDEVIAYLDSMSQTVSSLNIIAIPFLVISSILLLNSIEYALNKIWQVYEHRSVAHRLSIFCAILVIAPILAISAYYTTRFRVEPFLYGVSEGMGFLTDVYNFLLPALIDFLAFASLYYLVPKAPVMFRAAATGAFFAAILFDFAKSQFAFYISHFTSYEKIYGAIALVPIFFFWLYLAWVIVLFGAEISYQAQYLPRTGRLWRRALLSVGDGKLVLGIQALIAIGKAFTEGRALPSDTELSERLGCSSLVLKPALEALKRAGIIARGDSREMPLTLKRSPDKITLEDIQRALFESEWETHYPREVSDIFLAFSKNEAPARITLADVLKDRGRDDKSG